MTESSLERAVKLVLALFAQGPAEYEDVIRNCDDILALMNLRGESAPQRDELIREVESRVVIWQERSTSLEDRTGHQDWLAEDSGGIDWRFWDRYRRFLEQVELLPPAVISRLDDSTDRVLAKLESPRRAGAWDRRGLVVGQVQSGKTGHYTALACKAADAGYRLIVVLAGTHNSLRSQTQLRLDEGLLGFDSQGQFRSDEKGQARIGVGTLPGVPDLKIGSLTNSHEAGDFKKVRAQNLALPIGDMPVVLVVKKNGGILKNLTAWITQMHGEQAAPDSAELIIRGIPLLVIDDEADTASINTKRDDEDPTVINERIRLFLKSFEKSAYVGYTATPFANIFTSLGEGEKFGMDVFPRHFIENLKPPSNYFGPTRVFGLASEDAELAALPLPIFRKVDDYQDWMPDQHKKDHYPDAGAFPPSLTEAIYSFFLVCAARRARGQASKHSSMLIHTTRFVQVQRLVSEQVDDLVTSSRYRLRYGDGDRRSLWKELEDLWERDFAATSEAWDSEIEACPWSMVRDHVAPAVEKVQVRTINGDSRDALQYFEHRDAGLSVIAIGGDKLSRGLTLEGLSVSYYLRATRMYDTLMQMGRWFGYRPGYEDLCRLYTTTTLHDWYREITAASEELRADFDDMARQGATPEDFGLRVRQSSAGLSVTAPAKMRRARTVKLTFSGDLSESVTFDLSTAAVKRNWDALSSLVARLSVESGEPNITPTGDRVWSNCSSEPVVEFFESYRADRMATRARPQLLADYIRRASQQGELVSWTVAVISNSDAIRANRVAHLGPHVVGLTKRTPLGASSEAAADGRYTIRRVLSPMDETLDFTNNQREAALAELRQLLLAAATPEKPFKEPDYPRGRSLRRQRDPRRGLLLIYVLDNELTVGKPLAELPLVGFAASFPESEQVLAVEYRVTETWFRQVLEVLDDDED